MNDFDPHEPIFTSRRMEQQWNRQQGVKMVKSGTPVKDVAKFFGVSVRSVFKWVEAFTNYGQDGLLAKDGAGRPPKLNPDQMRWIATLVREHTPDQLKFESGLWTLRLIGELIEREFGLRLCRPTVSKIMWQQGFTPQRPLHRAYEQDAQLVQNWIKQGLPALRKQAKSKGARLMFADESSLRNDYHAGTTWAPRGKTPVVQAMGKRHTVNMMSAISSLGELEFMLVDGNSNSYVFKHFLEQLILGTQQPIILVVDNSSIHTAKHIKEYVESTNGILDLHFLPPYSPQLNPDEQVWKNVKERVAKQFPRDKYEMSALVRKAFKRLQETPDIVRGFFAHPECGFVN